MSTATLDGEVGGYSRREIARGIDGLQRLANGEPPIEITGGGFEVVDVSRRFVAAQQIAGVVGRSFQSERTMPRREGIPPRFEEYGRLIAGTTVEPDI